MGAVRWNWSWFGIRLEIELAVGLETELDAIQKRNGAFWSIASAQGGGFHQKRGWPVRAEASL